jgi:hypothetical protein
LGYVQRHHQTATVECDETAVLDDDPQVEIVESSDAQGCAEKTKTGKPPEELSNAVEVQSTLKAVSVIGLNAFRHSARMAECPSRFPVNSYRDIHLPIIAKLTM